MASGPPFRVKAVYEYKSVHDDDLSFEAGEVITVTEEEDDDWYVGEYSDGTGNKRSGLFPRNFVEKFEPEAPPRPNRSRPKKEAQEEPAVDGRSTTVEPDEAETTPSQPAEPTATSVPAATPAAAPAPVTVPVPAAPKAEVAKPAPAAAATSPPVPAAEKVAPPVSSKPTSSSFRDRIAAFNKPSAPPVAPKPAGPVAPGASSFIKKPFVAPPPSRHAYVPPPPRQDPVQKVYRREEDPEIAEQQKQDRANAEAAGLAGTEESKPEEGDGQEAKATSLKERIALLQKQQQEQAMRRAETAGKEKKRPPKPPSAVGGAEAGDAEADADAADTSRASADTLRDPPRPPPAARRPSKEPRAAETLSILSDGNEADESGAGNTTEDAGEDESTEVESEERPRLPAPGALSRTSTAKEHEYPKSADTVRVDAENKAPEEIDEPANEEEAGGEAEVDDDDDEDIDPEARRKMELRERMAKMSGGMGMPGMFGGMGMPMPGGAAKSRPAKPLERKSTQDSEESARSPPPAPRAPMVPIPGMAAKVTSPRSEEPPSVTKEEEEEEEDDDGESTAVTNRPPAQIPDVEEVKPVAAAPPVPKAERGAPPPVPGGRPVPAPAEARAMPPPPPPARPHDPIKEELEAEEELLDRGKELPAAPRAVPPLPTAPPPPSRPEAPRSAPSHSSKRSSVTIPNLGPVFSDEVDRRASRPPPPIPGTSASGALPPVDARPPPPPPPAAAPPHRRAPHADATEPGDGESEYEGDYDTDIGSAVPHKDALKAHHKNDSVDESTLSGDAMSPVRSPPLSAGAIPVPSSTARGPPPPLPSAPRNRSSVDAPRAVPPPPPTRSPGSEDDEYDPFRYGGSPPVPQHLTTGADDVQKESDPALYASSPPALPRQPPPPPAAPQSPPPQVHAVPPPLPPPHQTLPPAAAGSSNAEAARPSLDVPRQSLSTTRRSAEQPRASLEQGPLARDVDLETASQWWVHPQTAPPSLQSRGDVLLEFEESTASKRGGRSTTSRDVYVLYPDFSSSTISVRFDPKEPAEASLEQHHEPPPHRPSQDQLEAFHQQFSKAIVSSLNSASNTSIDDGSPMALVRHALGAVPTALSPIGARTFGALVYSNMGNASTTQADEIRPGDIVSFRNAKFSGKHGAMHAKYNMDVGEPEHVAVVSEWDGTKKKVRAWEQGRGNKKVKIESFKLGDLRSGEVKVWRVVPRAYVGWDGESS